MSRHAMEPSISTQRLLASAIGMAIGAMSVAPALHAAEAKKENDGVVSLDATSVVGEKSDGTSYQVERTSSPKMTAPLVDTPRSVTVVPQQVIRDTAAVSLQDALRTVPGITMDAGEGGNPQGDRPFIRGFDAQSDTFLDGVRDTGAQTQRYTADINRQFLDSGAFRLNLVSHESNVAGRDKVDYDRWGVAPSLAFGLGTDTRVNLDYYHLESDDLPDSGIPYGYSVGTTHTAARPDKRTDGGDSSNFYGLTNRDLRKTRTDIATFAFEHDLSDSLTIRNTLRHGSSMQDYILTQPDDSQGNVRNGTVWRSANTRVSNTDTSTNQTDLFGDFYLAGFKNSFSTGIEFTREESDRSSYNVDTNTNGPGGANKCVPAIIGAPSGYNCTSLSNPNPNDPWSGAISRNYASTETTGDTRAVYFFDTIELDPQWLLNVGLRYDNFQTDSKTKSAAGATTFKTSDTSEFVNGQLGLVWKPAENGSVYASYATSATPPGAMLGEGQDGNPLPSSVGTPTSIVSDLEPEETTNYELGTKWDVLDNRLSLTAAIFRTEKENTRVLVSNYTYENAGKTRVDGIELTASGKLTDKWQVFAGYSYLDSEVVDPGAVGNRAGVVTSGVNPAKGNELPNTPKNSFSLWTTYEVVPKLTIGGGAFYVDDVFGDTNNTVYVPSYWRYDAMASYQLTENVDLQLNVQNLTDEVYYDKAYSAHFANQAAGRTALFTTSVHF
ncbi:TonB-dependent siderophore receptor [Metapseudomonas resinovorans]|uniref:Putative TonB-dependent siderophore receptor n=1 Tax=Metapseudomonas resinovorans NBRC 106553 TaxID=1245471 RepID=S6AVD5_METRE|nr:TonB-dependent receptor [Pseudomonas resinovorans]BAN50193.1 putative TonB-dependent siderophore receptor [Pseudomonas resinovorans NBRC 106553]